MDRLRDLLVRIAGERSTISYDELRQQLDLDGDIVPMLRALSVAEDEQGRGLLTAVVVRTDTGKPGVGWFRLADERGRDVSDPDAAWHAERERLRREHGTT